jgi:type IV pilus assembly protein PilO
MMDKLKALAWYYQLIVLVVVAALIYAAVWYFITSPTRVEIQGLNDQIGQLQAKNQAAQIATQRINEFRSLFASKTAEYDELKVLLPEDREITNVLQGLQDTARGSRLILSRFTPREDTQQDSIMAKPVEIEVDSSFNNLREFFDKIAKLQRIVSITDFSLKQLSKQAGDRTLHAQFLLTAYYATPENLIQQKPDPKAKPNKKDQKGNPDPKDQTPPPAAPAPAAK